MQSGMGNTTSAGEGEVEDVGKKDEWTSREDTEASSGLWSVSHEIDDDQQICVFTCAATLPSQMQLCQAGVEHLRLLRHPNILKFLNCDVSTLPVVLVTEPVLPVKTIMNGMCAEGVVTGWRGVAQGLEFLHDKAKLSHNSLCCECVYVCVDTSRWKIGGFEAAAHHDNITNNFIEKIADIRTPNTIPPEDKSPSAESSLIASVPCHSRDVWALGRLILYIIEDVGLNSLTSDSMYEYIQQHMLNNDPTLRPTVTEVLSQHWTRNDVSEIADFLSHLTIKSQAEKDDFFFSIASRLHSLPPRVVAEHLIPLLLNPLVMTEHVASRCLWPHLLTPASAQHPKKMKFDSSQICPILDEELFIYHAVPLILNMMESHDYHVRKVLLEHLIHFAPFCPQDELIASLLPEVLVGLHDCHDDMVKATLKALADLVDILGGEVVIGTQRSSIFADSAPRSRTRGPLEEKTAVLQLPSTLITLPSSQPNPPSLSSSMKLEEMRRQRAEKMREKREMQKQKKMATNSKLGVASNVVDVESEGLTTPPDHAQYSPSVSHDEEDRPNDTEITVGGEEREGIGDREEEEKEDEEWEEFTEEGEVDNEHEWVGRKERGDNKPETGSWSQSSTGTDILRNKENGAKGLLLGQNTDSLKLGNNGGKKMAKNETNESSHNEGWDKQKLSEDDQLRLQEQASWSKEPDFFADMMPVVTKTSDPLESGPEMGENIGKSSLQYQPLEIEEEGDGWGGWNDF